LNDREAHYLGNVLRLKVGDQLVAFDGAGTERRASLKTVSKRGAELELHETLDALAESSLVITLLQSLAKADAMDFIVQKATELGVHAIVPVYTEFSVVKLEEDRAQRRVEHWTRIAQSACEQCGRHSPPHIEAPEPLAARLAKLRPDDLKLVLDPGADERIGDIGTPVSRVTFVIGPEGGLSPSDFRQIDASGCKRVRLGPRVLRTETAAIAACAATQWIWGDF
jgi:16S rRNA (uracil1498-N3)-methyltransferase